MGLHPFTGLDDHVWTLHDGEDYEPGYVYSITADDQRIKRKMTCTEKRESDEHGRRFFAWLDERQACYQHAIDALKRVGINASMWHTGGGCLAIGANLGEGEYPHMMLTCEEPLPNERKRVVFDPNEVNPPNLWHPPDKPNRSNLPRWESVTHCKTEEDHYNHWFLGIYRSENSLCYSEGYPHDDGRGEELDIFFHDPASDDRMAARVAEILREEGLMP